MAAGPGVAFVVAGSRSGLCGSKDPVVACVGAVPEVACVVACPAVVCGSRSIGYLCGSRFKQWPLW